MVSVLGHPPAATCPSLGFFPCKVVTALRGAVPAKTMAQGQARRAPDTQGLGRGLVGSGRACGEVLGTARSRVVSEEKVEAGRRDPRVRTRAEACELGSQSSAPRWAPPLGTPSGP